MSYSNSFTVNDINNIIASGKNTVVSYPAGTGKTTAIINWMSTNAYTIGKKIIYIAPSISLLDEMYNRLIDAGILPGLIFNYHSKSASFHKYLKDHINEPEEILVDRLINKSNIILITHKRMMFENSGRFLGSSSLFHSKPVVFIDEAVEPCLIARIKQDQVKYWLYESRLIDVGQDIDDYNSNLIYNEVTRQFEDKGPGASKYNASKLFNVLVRQYPLIDKPIFTGTNTRMKTPREMNIDLGNESNSFESEKYTKTIENRLSNLYGLIAIQIATKEFTNNESEIILHVPIALQSVWKTQSQCIVMDATGNLTRSLYEDYEFYESNNWNFNKLTNVIYHSNELTKSKLVNKPEYINIILNSIDLNKFNKIYIVTNRSLLQRVADFIESKYKNSYRIVYSIANPQTIISNIDYNSDEDYNNISDEKVIYITNYGRTRGSNVFRDCECLIQLGVFRLNVEYLQLMKHIYPNAEAMGNDLALANYLQELYRGCIRLDKPMTSYSIMDDYLFDYLTNLIPNFSYSSGVLNELNFLIKDSIIDRNRYGTQGEIIRQLYEAKYNNITLHKEDLFRIFKLDRLDNIRRTLSRLYNNYSELRADLFNKYPEVNSMLANLYVGQGTSNNDVNFTLT